MNGPRGAGAALLDRTRTAPDHLAATFKEIEIRLRVPDPADLSSIPQLLSDLGFTLQDPRTQRVTDTYLDTADWRLFRASLACRLRRSDHSTVLGVKTLAEITNGASHRLELVENLPDSPVNLPGPLPGAEIRRWLGKFMHNVPVEPKLHLDQYRTIYEASSSAGLRLLVYGDLVTVRPGNSFARLELELVDGEPRALYSLGKAIRKRTGFRTEKLSKLERGLRLIDVSLPVLVEPDDLTLRRDDRFVDSAFRVLRRHFNRLRWHDPGTRTGIDPEHLHEMRVASRRLAAAFRVFAPALPPARVNAFKRDLKWLGRALGPVRDLDVYIASFESKVHSVLGEFGPGLDLYRRRLNDERNKARRAMLRILNTKRYDSFISRLHRFLDAGPGDIPSLLPFSDSPQAPSPQPLPSQAPGPRPQALSPSAPSPAAASSLLLAEIKKIRKSVRALPPSASDEALHRLRIRMKRLRYLAEFFTDLFGRPVERLALRAKSFQDLLGDHHDAIVAQQKLRAFAKSAKGPKRLLRDISFALGQLMPPERQTAKDTRRAFFKSWARFDRRKSRRKLRDRLNRLASIS